MMRMDRKTRQNAKLVLIRMHANTAAYALRTHHSNMTTDTMTK